MTLTLLRAADRIAAPWKNGGGVTREVVAWPPGAGFDDFQWRISMAEVREDGPFSPFAGVDRILAVLDGRLRLAVAGRPEVVLDEASPPASFPGDVATMGYVQGRPVTDLNLMVRRAWGQARLQRLSVLLPQDVGPLAPVVAVVAGGPVRVTLPTAACDLEPHDAVLVRAPGERLLLEAARPAEAFLAAFEAMQAPSPAPPRPE